jgi:hypothetical protein
MAELTPDDAVAIARGAFDAALPGKTSTWRVERIDRPGQAYYLVIFGDDRSPVAVAAVTVDTGERMTSAFLNGTRPHLSVDAARALRLANVDRGVAKLVWRPCSASMSALYPFWSVTSSTGTVFIDQLEKRWDRLEATRA